MSRAGAAPRLNRLHTRKAKPTTPIELLRTDIRATTFVGRETYFGSSRTARRITVHRPI